MGPDGHGYCRTYGSSAPPSLVYTGSTTTPNSTLVEFMIQQVTDKVMEKLDGVYAKKHEEFKAQIMSWLESNDRISANLQVRLNY